MERTTSLPCVYRFKMQLFRGVWVKMQPEERTDQFRYGLMSVESAETRTPPNIPVFFFFVRARSNECLVSCRTQIA